MKTQFKALFVALLLAASGRAATINFGASIDNGFSLADGTDLPSGGLVRLGWFRDAGTGATLTAAQIQALAGSPATLNASFVEVATSSIGAGVAPIDAAHFLASATADTAGLGVAGKQMALWVFNASTLGAATQQAILFWDISDTTTNPDNKPVAPGARWAFPAQTTTIDITDLTTGSGTLAAGAKVVVGTFPTGTSDISDAPNFGLAAISGVSPAGPTIATGATLPGGTVGVNYAQPLSATGGAGGYEWSLQSGALPGGLTLNPQGAIGGTPNAEGTFNFTVLVKDSSNATATKALSLTISPAGSSSGVTHQLLAQSGTSVPAGTSAAGVATIPAGATWLDVGQPAIDDAGHVAYSAKWLAGKVRSSGIFRDSTFLVGVGDPVPDAAGAVFSAFYDPLVGPDGSVAFLATLGGAGVTPATKTALCIFAADGTGKTIARTGVAAPETDGALFDKLGDIAFAGTSAAPRIYFTAKLKKGFAPLLAGTGSGIWLAEPEKSSTPRLALRSGASLSGFAFGEKISSLTLFLPLAGSTGHGRGIAAGGSAHFIAALNTKRQALLKFDGAAAKVTAVTGASVGGKVIPTTQWKSFRLPSSAADGSGMAFYGTLVPKVAGVTAADSPGIFIGGASGFEPLVRPGQTATPLDAATFASFLDPVMSPDGDAVAFCGFVKGAGVTPATDQVLWLADANATLSVIAREGTNAVGGGTWKAFTSVAFPGGGRGPLFLATLKTGGAITAANDTGAWAVDSKGALQRLFGEGDTFGGQPLKSFTLLKASLGSKGATHSFNATGTVAWRAVFKNGAAVLKTTIP